MNRLQTYWCLFRLSRSYLLSFYLDWEECNQEIAKQLEHSNEAAILSIKGRDLWRQPQPFRDVLQSKAHARKRTRILLQSPTSRYVDEHVRKVFQWPTLEEYREDLKTSIGRLMSLVGNPPGDSLKIALYDAIPILKLYIFDNKMYVGFYEVIRVDQSRGRIPGVWCLRRRSGRVGPDSAVESHFESLWRHSVPATDVIDLAVEQVSLQEQPVHTRLRERICKHFNESELRTLCSDVQVDYDDLLGETKTGKVREFISYLNRRGRIVELIEICTRQRPHVSWKDVP